MSFTLDYDSIQVDYNIGLTNHESNTMPCMFNSTTDSVIENIDELQKKFKLIDSNLSNEIKEFYNLIKSSSQEIYIKEWTLFSIDNIYKFILNYRKNNIYITDIGLKYLGMGHCIVAFYDPKTNMIYYRMDGGSSGHDRDERFNALKNYKSSEQNEGFTFNTFLKQINEEQCNNVCIF
tara:strand:- start:4955 stop:5488 length:534 start_codon:yes stop_codon:yes gene_type:complete